MQSFLAFYAKFIAFLFENCLASFLSPYDGGFSWQDGSRQTRLLNPAKGQALWTPKMLGASFSHFKDKKAKDMQNKQRHLSKRITIRLTEDEARRLHEYTDIAQVSMSDYVRKRLYGGRPLIPKTDLLVINELRRIGALLKHNFIALREAHAPQECFDRQEHALQELVKAMRKIGTSERR